MIWSQKHKEPLLLQILCVVETYVLNTSQLWVMKADRSKSVTGK